MTVNVPEGLQDIRTLAQTTGKDHLIDQLQALDRKYGSVPLTLMVVSTVADILDSIGDEAATEEWYDSAPPEAEDLVKVLRNLLANNDPASAYAQLKELEPKKLASTVFGAGIFLQVFRDQVVASIDHHLDTLGDDAA